MTKEERAAKFRERQREIQLANDAARGYMPPTPKKRKRLIRCENDETFETKLDDLGESPDY